MFCKSKKKTPKKPTKVDHFVLRKHHDMHHGLPIMHFLCACAQGRSLLDSSLTPSCRFGTNSLLYVPVRLHHERNKIAVAIRAE